MVLRGSCPHCNATIDITVRIARGATTNDERAPSGNRARSRSRSPRRVNFEEVEAGWGNDRPQVPCPGPWGSGRVCRNHATVRNALPFLFPRPDPASLVRG